MQGRPEGLTVGGGGQIEILPSQQKFTVRIFFLFRPSGRK